MAEPSIKHKNLWTGKLKNITQKEWMRFATLNNLPTTQPHSGTSHTLTIRDPRYPDSTDIHHLVTVQANMHKIANEKTFKKVMTFGFTEDQIWKGLGLL